MKYRYLLAPLLATAVIGGLALAGSAQGDTPSITAPAVEVAAPVAPVATAAPDPAPEVATVSEPVHTSTSAPFQAPWTPDPGPAPGAPPRSVCAIEHASNGTRDFWSAHGFTELPRGTMFVFTVEADGERIEVPLVAQAGSAVVDGVGYGHPGEYEDRGQSNFGPTSGNMPSLAVPHGPVTARVTLDGVTVCST